MFFVAAKIAWMLLAPLNFIAALVLCGLLSCRLHWRRLATLFFATAFVLFVAIGVFPVGEDLLARLETRYPRPATLPEQVTGILILGGALDTKLSAVHGYPVMGLNAQRVMEAVRLARLYPHAKLVFTGGENSLAGHQLPESVVLQSYFRRYGITVPQNVIYESRSRNTAENFANAGIMVHPRAGETWILVTSAFHLPRAMATAQAEGWPPMIPWAANYLTEDKIRWLPDNFDLAGHFFLADVALREYAGLLGYRLFQRP